jgi:hypothetical protein
MALLGQDLIEGDLPACAGVAPAVCAAEQPAASASAAAQDPTAGMSHRARRVMFTGILGFI